MHDTTLAILAGGESSRMRVSKAAVTVTSKPILNWLLDQIKWQGPTLLVTAPGRENPAGAGQFGREVTDPVAGQGPVRGILTALENAPTPIIVVATVDMPFIRYHHLAWMAQHLTDHSALRGVMLSRKSNSGPMIEPFPSAYRMSAAKDLAGQLAQHRRAVHGLLKIEGFNAIEAPDDWQAKTWMNLNTPKDLDEFLQSPDIAESK